MWSHRDIILDKTIDPSIKELKEVLWAGEDLVRCLKKSFSIPGESIDHVTELVYKMKIAWDAIRDLEIRNENGKQNG